MGAMVTTKPQPTNSPTVVKAIVHIPLPLIVLASRMLPLRPEGARTFSRPSLGSGSTGAPAVKVNSSGFSL